MKIRDWYWIDWAFFTVRGVWYILWIIIFTNEFRQLQLPLSALLIWLSIAFFVPQCFMRPVNKKGSKGYPLMELVSSGSLYIYLLLMEGTDSSLMLIPAVILGLYFSRCLTWWISACFVLLVPTVGLIIGSGSPVILLTHILNNSIALGVGFAFNRMIFLLTQNRNQYQMIQEQNQILEQYANKVEFLTLLQERNRMARELHDTLGHTFTSVIIGMDGVISNLAKFDYEKAANKLQKLRHFTKEGLDEIRKSIHEMAPIEDEEVISKQLARLAYEFAENTNTHLTFETKGMEATVAYNVQMTLIRCLQEALTNAKRHGKADRITISLEFSDEQLVLKIKDNGFGINTIKHGFGLTAMKERIESLQGNLNIQSQKGLGTEIICSLPNKRRRH